MGLLGGVALLENVEKDLEVSYAQSMLGVSIHFLLPMNQDVGISATSPSPCLLAYHHVSYCDDNGLNFWNVGHSN